LRRPSWLSFDVTACHCTRFTEPSLLAAMIENTRAGLAPRSSRSNTKPTEVWGAPESRAVQGGDTIRRLKEAQSRHPSIPAGYRSRADRRLQQCWAAVVMPSRTTTGDDQQPEFSSETLWHQDIRYWSYQRPDLVSVVARSGRETRTTAACASFQDTLMNSRGSGWTTAVSCAPTCGECGRSSTRR